VFEDVEKMRRRIMKIITAKEFDEKFDNGEDISEYLDFSKATRANALKTDTKKVNVDFPQWVVEYNVPTCQDHLTQYSYFTNYATNCNSVFSNSKLLIKVS
jgi:hypothetical protein